MRREQRYQGYVLRSGGLTNLQNLLLGDLVESGTLEPIDLYVEEWMTCRTCAHPQPDTPFPHEQDGYVSSRQYVAEVTYLKDPLKEEEAHLDDD